MLKKLDAESVQCCVTSPPYFALRDYGVPNQLGLEATPELYVARLVEIFREVRRVLRNDGTLWLNLGDSYAGGASRGDSPPSGKQATNKGTDFLCGKAAIIPSGLKQKDLYGIPWMVAFALRSDGWYLRSEIIWHKPNPMPESVTDRPTKSHEQIFLLAKSSRYYYDADAVSEPAIHAGKIVTLGPKSLSRGQATGMNVNPSGNGKADSVVVGAGRNRRSVWTVTTKPYRGAHFATFPPKLIEPCILAGCPEGGTILDCFAGAGTSLLVAIEHGRSGIGIELNPAYIKMAWERLSPHIPAQKKPRTRKAA